MRSLLPFNCPKRVSAAGWIGITGHADLSPEPRAGARRLLGLELQRLAGRRLLPATTAGARVLRFYVERFETVEVNTSFYRLTRRDSVAPWAGTTPDEFVFSVRVSRFITHVKRLGSGSRSTAPKAS